jgi:hypothetical protein
LEKLFALGGVDGGVDAEVAGEDTIDIAIDDGSGEAEGDAPDGGSGIVAYALEFPDFFEGVREMAEGDDLLGGVVEVAGSAVIAQALPLAQHLVFRGGGKGLNGRPSVHKALPVVPALLDLRLLEDDLGEPNGVRVAGLPPRQIATVLTEPLKES